MSRLHPVSRVSSTASAEELRSSAVTLSDMEIFVFPELMFSLVLANILSPILWRWRDDPWFADIRTLKPYKRMQRLRQYIMDHYVFNLDLDTWGLTRQEKELERFSSFLSRDVIAQSNALFGYHGDSYYFDIDIRTHFGLDKYGKDVIPYWKTETVEAMSAFCFKPGFTTGAGECVSLAALYAAALFVVAGIPLDEIYLMATPLHSQNFVDWKDGVLINNRRLVTKSMWFNGTQISGQARRALEHERVTVVSHQSGWIHLLYEEASLSPEAYQQFSAHLRSFLKTTLTVEVFQNFLRAYPAFQLCFALPVHRNEGVQYLPLEKLYLAEEQSAFQASGLTRERLVQEIPDDAFSDELPEGRVSLASIESWLKQHPLSRFEEPDLALFSAALGDLSVSADRVARTCFQFCETIPRLPNASDKKFVSLEKPIQLQADMTRDEILSHLVSIRSQNVMAELAFYAWRDLSRTSVRPFLKAAMERNPVSCEATRSLSWQEALRMITDFAELSIYEEPFRFAQPDEVWNFRRGDGWEKALLMANLFLSRNPDCASLSLVKKDQVVSLLHEGGELCSFRTQKEANETTWVLR